MFETLLTILAALLTAILPGYLLWVAKQRREAYAVNLAVLAEIQRLQKVLYSQARWWRERAQAGDMPRALPLVVEIFDQYAGQIGVVDKRYLSDAVRFYGYVRFINQLIGVQESYEARGEPERFGEDYLKLLHKAHRHFEGRFDAAFARWGLAADTGGSRRAEATVAGH